MTPIKQSEALNLEAHGKGDVARLWRRPEYDDLDCLSARFVEHRYAPHSHETYVVGIISSGAEAFRCRGETWVAPAGTFCVVEPEEVHDGEPADGGDFVYHMIYPSPALMQRVLEDAGDNDPAVSLPRFDDVVIRDPSLFDLYIRLHSSLTGDAGTLARDEAMTMLLTGLVRRHARTDLQNRHLGREIGPVARVRALIDACYGDDLDLDALACVAGLSRYRLIRAFGKEMGLTPHAYLVDRRVRAARGLLARGHGPAEVAAATGFADQSHLTRAFKARLGIPPGRYRNAVMSA